MRVLAFDPGYDRLGIAVVQRIEGNDVLLYSACLETNRASHLTERLGEVGKRVEELLTTHTPDAVAVETLFFNTNQKTAIGVAEARGIILYLALIHGCRVFEFGPQEIKVAITGYGKSDKHAVITMIKRLVHNAPVKALDDEYDAIAVGITALAHNAHTYQKDVAEKRNI